eukprot:m.49994 g.49994  ORF g.49994 m.49994 type:complete len:51 (+) comp10642_c0_seq4:1811-1963(+)
MQTEATCFPSDLWNIKSFIADKFTTVCEMLRLAQEIPMHTIKVALKLNLT